MLGLRAYLFGAAALAAVAFAWWAGHALYNAGYQARVVEETAAAQEKTDASNRADDAARLCSTDPVCRLRSDPYERR